MGRVENEEGDYGRFLLSLVVYCIKTIILIWLNVDYDDYLINVAIMSGCNDIADYLKNIRRNKK